MKYIERLGQKLISHLGGLETKKTCGEDEGRSSHGGGGPWEPALITLESLVAGERSLGRKTRHRLRLGERERGLRRK
jgi:hypothetical protein